MGFVSVAHRLYCSFEGWGKSSGKSLRTAKGRNSRSPNLSKQALGEKKKKDLHDFKNKTSNTDFMGRLSVYGDKTIDLLKVWCKSCDCLGVLFISESRHSSCSPLGSAQCFRQQIPLNLPGLALIPYYGQWARASPGTRIQTFVTLSPQ